MTTYRKKSSLKIKKYLLVSLCFVSYFLYSQEGIDSLDVVEMSSSEQVIVTPSHDSLMIDSIKKEKPYLVSPTKAALYSAVLPGAGQLYNKKYWKVPLVLGLLGTGVGFIAFYQNRYQDLRTAYIAELNGETHQYSDLGLSAETLGKSQADEKRFRDYAIVITSLVYILNILDAAVDAHLYEVRKDPDLKLNPTVLSDEKGKSTIMGLGLSLRF